LFPPPYEANIEHFAPHFVDFCLTISLLHENVLVAQAASCLASFASFCYRLQWISVFERLW
jgi:hypothetical protein